MAFLLAEKIMLIVGLTGGIGSGKTAVSDLFANLGITIVDADVCARVVVEPGRPALDKIRQHFGDDILLDNGELDRAALRQRVFQNADEKTWLESLLHPLIGEEIMQQLQAATSPYVLFVSPLLVESKQNLICDRVIVVDVPEKVQIERTCARDDNDSEQVKRIMANQADRNTRLAAASDIIENTQGFDHLENEVKRLHSQFLELAQEKQDKS